MAFDPLKDAASILLFRESGEGPSLEIFLLRRHRKSGFMASSFVFPGGIAEESDGGDPRTTAARETFEEAGVLLSRPPVDPALAHTWRPQVDGGDADLGELLSAQGARLDPDALHYFAHWMTPSAEGRRYSARFYCALLPAGQTATACNRETHDELWITPGEALARRGELRLPPPQVRSLMDLQDACEKGWDAVVALCAERAKSPQPIMPRLCPLETGFALLLPWDPDYESKGQGDARAMPANHPLATGPSRFVLTDAGWIHE